VHEHQSCLMYCLIIAPASLAYARRVLACLRTPHEKAPSLEAMPWPLTQQLPLPLLPSQLGVRGPPGMQGHSLLTPMTANGIAAHGQPHVSSGRGRVASGFTER
jgi:hypothetical protein